MTPTTGTCVRCREAATHPHCDSPTCPWWLCAKCSILRIAGMIR